MKVNVHAADLGGCGHYRMIWPTRALAEQGANVDLVLPEDPRSEIQCFPVRNEDGTQSLAGITDSRVDCDVIVFQRPMTRLLFELMPLLQAKGIAVVMEIDDDFATIHPQNSAWHASQPSVNPEKNFQWLGRCMERADHVICTTPALAARYGAHGRVSVIENHVPERYFDIDEPELDTLRVGWSGSIATHPKDLQVTRGEIGKVLDRRGLTFHHIGSGEGVARSLGITTQIAHTGGWLHLEQYPEGMAKLDIGLVPLEMSAFNRAKSWLKGLEFAAVGTPFIATPTPDYLKLQELGIGMLAESRKDWRRQLELLLDDDELRATQRDRNRELAREWTIEANAWKWWDAFELARKHRDTETRRTA